MTVGAGEALTEKYPTGHNRATRNEEAGNENDAKISAVMVGREQKQQM